MRQHDSECEGMSRSEIGEMMEIVEFVEGGERYEYLLVSRSVFYLISSYPEAFRLAIASEDESFWHLLDSLRTFDSYRERWLT
jgi:hypothetical protein